MAMVAARSKSTDSPLEAELKRPKSRRRWVLIMSLVVVAGGGFFGWRHLSERASAQPRFSTATADRGRIIGRVTATGTSSALVTVQVGSQVSGRIQALYADF